MQHSPGELVYEPRGTFRARAHVQLPLEILNKEQRENMRLLNLPIPSHNSLSQLMGEKSVAITIMITAIAKWGCNIGDTASQAADCCGFSTETVRQSLLHTSLPPP